MIHEMTKLELEVRCISSLSFNYLPAGNKTGPFECPCVYIYIHVSIYQSGHALERTIKKHSRKKGNQMF